MGDKVTAEFFREVKEKPASRAITKLHDSSRATVTDRTTLERTSHSFYQQLYQDCPTSDGHRCVGRPKPPVDVRRTAVADVHLDEQTSKRIRRTSFGRDFPERFPK
jgi:hypothetical protein